MTTMEWAAFVVGVLGFAAMVLGVALLSPPAALVLGGMMCLLWSGFTARALARRPKKA